MGKISVIVPVYNGENDIEKCILMLLKQTFQDIEIIIINDGSSDNTEEICKALQKKDERIILYNQENGGPSVARNKGMELASGDWITFVDSDDWLEIDCLEYVYKVVLEEEDTDVVLWNLQDERNGVSIPHVPFKGEQRVFYEKDISKIKNILFTDKTETRENSLSIKGPTSKLIKREIIKDCYFPVEFDLGEDVCFAHQMYDKIHKLVYINKMFYHRNIKEYSLSQKIDIARGERRSKYTNWVLMYREGYDKKVLNEFVYLKYRMVVFDYMDTRLNIPYKIRKQRIEKYLKEINWEIDFTNLVEVKSLFLLKNKMYFVIYVYCLIKNMLRPIYRYLKEVKYIVLKERK